MTLRERWQQWIRKLLAWLASINADSDDDEHDTPSDPPVTPPSAGHRASFLFDKARVRVMNCLSLQMDDAAFRAIVQRCKANGDTLMYVYLANCGDGAPPVTSFYKGGGYGIEVNPDAVKTMRTRIQHIRSQGMGIVAWLTPDDSPSIYKASHEQHLRHVHSVVEEFGDLIDEYVVGLEMDSDPRCQHAAAMIEYGRKQGGKRWGVHLNPGKTAPLYGADTLYYQKSGFNPSKDSDVASFGNEIRRVRAALPSGIRLIAAEYHGSSDSQNAKALGKVAIANGADGTGTGIASSSDPLPAPAGDTITITNVTKAGIRWTGPNLAWPLKGDCCGEAHVYRANGEGGKFEHVRPTTRDREWKNIRDCIRDGYGVWARIGEPENGESCTFQLVSYDGKKKTNKAAFRWVR
jgi:hypothetical protein